MADTLNLEAALSAVERRLPAILEDAKYEWGEACGGPSEHEIYAQKILSAVRDELGRASPAAAPDGALPPLPSNTPNVTRRIRRCQEEFPAQVVLEHFAKEYARAAVEADRASQQQKCAPPFAAPAGQHDAYDLPPVEYDKDMDRTYIPLPGGWEVQTKGKGSTFRLAHAPSDYRWMVLDEKLHEPLEALARDVRNALATRCRAEEAK